MDGSASLQEAGKNKIEGNRLILDLKDDKITAIGDNYKRVEGLYYESNEEGENKK